MRNPYESFWPSPPAYAWPWNAGFAVMNFWLDAWRSVGIDPYRVLAPFGDPLSWLPRVDASVRPVEGEQAVVVSMKMRLPAGLAGQQDELICVDAVVRREEPSVVSASGSELPSASQRELPKPERS